MAQPLSWKQITWFTIFGGLIPAGFFLSMVGIAFFVSGGPDVWLGIAPIVGPVCLGLYAIFMSGYLGYFIWRYATGIGANALLWSFLAFILCLGFTIGMAIQYMDWFVVLFFPPFGAGLITFLLIALKRRFASALSQ